MCCSFLVWMITLVYSPKNSDLKYVFRIIQSCSALSLYIPVVKIFVNFLQEYIHGSWDSLAFGFIWIYSLLVFPILICCLVNASYEKTKYFKHAITLTLIIETLVSFHYLLLLINRIDKIINWNNEYVDLDVASNLYELFLTFVPKSLGLVVIILFFVVAGSKKKKASKVEKE